MPAYESYRVNLNEKRYSAEMLAGFWIEDVCFPERKLFGLYSDRVLA
jgi:hypothetical protein